MSTRFGLFKAEHRLCILRTFLHLIECYINHPLRIKMIFLNTRHNFEEEVDSHLSQSCFHTIATHFSYSIIITSSKWLRFRFKLKEILQWPKYKYECKSLFNEVQLKRFETDNFFYFSEADVKHIKALSPSLLSVFFSLNETKRPHWYVLKTN